MAERAGASMCVHSNWVESGSDEASGVAAHYKHCGFDELMTCNDQPPVGNASTRQPRAPYQVFVACEFDNASPIVTLTVIGPVRHQRQTGTRAA